MAVLMNAELYDQSGHRVKSSTGPVFVRVPRFSGLGEDEGPNEEDPIKQHHTRADDAYKPGKRK